MHLYRARGALTQWEPTQPASAPPLIGGAAQWRVLSRNRRLIYWPGTVPNAAPDTPPPPTTASASWQLVTRTSRRAFSWQGNVAPPQPTPRVALQFVGGASSGASPASVGGIVNLRWAFFDSTDFPALLSTAPVDSGTTSTDNSGVFSVPLPHSTLAAGAEGWLIVSDSDGTAEQTPPSVAFCAPVKLT